MRYQRLALPGLARRNALVPFLKWPGGKRQLLGALTTNSPESFSRYIEPFVGGGALYFALQPDKAILGDLNAELMDSYRAVRDDVEVLIAALDRHIYDRDHYYAIRAQVPAELSLAERAARMIYLNKTGYNGLYRVNRKGEFNVPFGRFKTPPRFYDPDNLRGASSLLESADLLTGPYSTTIALAQPGDFVYLDPPYQPLSQSANFTRYTKEGFYPEDQMHLADTFRALDKIGCKVLLSNSKTPLVTQLYHEWNVVEVTANRLINSDHTRRQGIVELLVRNY